MTKQRFSAAANEERRLLSKEERKSGFMEHVGGFVRDWKETYVEEGMQRKGILDKMTAAIAGGMQIVLRGGDAIYDGVIGRKYEAPHGIAGNTRRDLWALGKDIIQLRPLHAAGDAWKLATSSVPQDIGDLVAGLRLSSHRHATRKHISATLTQSRPSHPTASIASKIKSQAPKQESSLILSA